MLILAHSFVARFCWKSLFVPCIIVTNTGITVKESKWVTLYVDCKTIGTSFITVTNFRILDPSREDICSSSLATIPSRLFIKEFYFYYLISLKFLWLRSYFNRTFTILQQNSIRFFYVHYVGGAGWIPASLSLYTAPRAQITFITLLFIHPVMSGEGDQRNDGSSRHLRRKPEPRMWRNIAERPLSQ